MNRFYFSFLISILLSVPAIAQPQAPASFSSGMGYSSSIGKPVQVSEPCPDLTSDAAVTKWRAAVVKIMADVSYESPKLIDQNLEECFPTKIPACLKRVAGYYGPYGEGSVGSYDRWDYIELEGYEAEKDPRRQMPKELLVSGSKDFNYVFRADAEAVAKAKGWPVVRYKSRHSGGFDRNTSSLLMIEVPGASLKPPVTYDRYVNIALPKDDDATADGTEPVPSKNVPSPEELLATQTSPGGDRLPKIATIVSVERATRSKPAQVFFQLFKRSRGEAAYKVDNEKHPTQRCYECHASGLREISPLGYGVDEGEKQLPPAAWNMVKRINQDMRNGQGDAPADWGNYKNLKTGKKDKVIDTDRYGPVIGPSEPLTRIEKKDMNGKNVVTFPTRSAEYIQACASSNPEISVTDIFDRPAGAKNIYQFTSSPPVNWQKVADAMDCQSCHDGVTRGELTQKTDMGLIQYKILVDKSMPHHMHRNPMDNGGPTAKVTDELNLNERIALSNCLFREANDELRMVPDWLTQVTCNENSKSPSAKRANELLNKLREKNCGPAAATAH